MLNSLRVRVAALMSSAVIAAGLLDSASFDLEAWKAAAIAALLAGVKAVVAQQFGNGTAATLPAKDEPTPPPTDGDAGDPEGDF